MMLFLKVVLLVLIFCNCGYSQKGKRDRDSLGDAEIGMMELQKTMRDPKALAEALQALKDPEIAKEVEAMMKDPQFKEDMKKYTNDPKFKEAMGKAADSVEKLSADPVRLKQLEVRIFNTIIILCFYLLYYHNMF